MGFNEKENTPGLFIKNIDDINFFWDFRKTKSGSAYASKAKEDGGFENIDRDQIEGMKEYLILRPEKKKANEKTKKPEEKTKAIVPVSGKKSEELLRGSERDIVRLMDHRIQLDSIIDASSSKDKLGEGLLWHELKFGNRIHVEPSAELVDMISLDMGEVTTRIVEFGTNTLEDPMSMKKYMTYYCVVEAKDGVTGTTGLGAAEQIIDFNEIANKGRTFARTNAIRKAERNAKERIIPIPRKAMVYLIRKKLDEHAKSMKG